MEIFSELLVHDDKTPELIFGERDAQKVLYCMTLFDDISQGDVFGEVLEKIFVGKKCEQTVALLEMDKHSKIDGPHIVVIFIPEFSYKSPLQDAKLLCSFAPSFYYRYII